MARHSFKDYDRRPRKCDEKDVPVDFSRLFYPDVLEREVDFIVAELINEIVTKSKNSFLRMYCFNLLSRDGYNNRDFEDLFVHTCFYIFALYSQRDSRDMTENIYKGVENMLIVYTGQLAFTDRDLEDELYRLRDREFERNTKENADKYDELMRKIKSLMDSYDDRSRDRGRDRDRRDDRRDDRGSRRSSRYDNDRDYDRDRDRGRGRRDDDRGRSSRYESSSRHNRHTAAIERHSDRDNDDRNRWAARYAKEEERTEPAIENEVENEIVSSETVRKDTLNTMIEAYGMKVDFSNIDRNKQAEVAAAISEKSQLAEALKGDHVPLVSDTVGSAIQICQAYYNVAQLVNAEPTIEHRIAYVTEAIIGNAKFNEVFTRLKTSKNFRDFSSVIFTLTRAAQDNREKMDVKSFTQYIAYMNMIDMFVTGVVNKFIRDNLNDAFKIGSITEDATAIYGYIRANVSEEAVVAFGIFENNFFNSAFMEFAEEQLTEMKEMLGISTVNEEGKINEAPLVDVNFITVPYCITNVFFLVGEFNIKKGEQIVVEVNEETPVGVIMKLIDNYKRIVGIDAVSNIVVTADNAVLTFARQPDNIDRVIITY